MSPRSLKFGTMGFILLGAIIGLFAGAQNWYTVHLTAASGHTVPVLIAGSAAAPAVTAFSFAGLALSLALGIAGRIARIVMGLLGVIVAACLLVEVSGTVSDPEKVSRSAVTTATGITGNASVHALIARIAASPWPALAVAAGIVIALGSIAVLVFGHRWPASSRRYEATRFEELPGGDAGPADLPSAVRRRIRPDEVRPGDAAVDDWDELSRGDDPTR